MDFETVDDWTRHTIRQMARIAEALVPRVDDAERLGDQDRSRAVSKAGVLGDLGVLNCTPREGHITLIPGGLNVHETRALPGAGAAD